MQLYKCFVGSSGDSLAFDMLGVICIKPAGALKMLVLRFFLIVRAGISAIQDSTPSAHSQPQPLHNCAQIGGAGVNGRCESATLVLEGGAGCGAHLGSVVSELLPLFAVLRLNRGGGRDMTQWWLLFVSIIVCGLSSVLT